MKSETIRVATVTEIIERDGIMVPVKRGRGRPRKAEPTPVPQA
jgi:hypothetical protein